MHNKKIYYYILMSIVVLALLGCKKKSNENDLANDNYEPSITALPTSAVSDNEAGQIAEDASHEGEMRSYLTGLWVSNEIGLQRPIAYQFNNFKTVSNQWGIGQADIVYECLVEGGITRLLGIGENYTGDRIGSTRSARHYFVSIADEYDAIYIHFGGTKYARSKVKELGIDEIDGNTGKGASVFYRDNTIKAPHNAFASLERMQKGIAKLGFETKYPQDYKPHFSFYEEDTELSNASAADNKVSVYFSAYNKPYFEYNAKDKLYYRFQFGAAHKDSNTGDQLAFKNIIIQFVKEWNIDKNGYQTMDLENAKGQGVYITNGKMVKITWKKKEADSWMRYYDEAGNELTINPGKTYIALFPNNRVQDVSIK